MTITVKEGESAGSLTNDDKAKLTGLSRGTYTVEEINNPEEYKTSAATVTLKDEDNGGTDCKYLKDNTTYVKTFKLGYKNDEADIDVITKTTDKSGDVTDYTYVESNGGVKGLVSYTNKLVTADLDLKKVDAKNDIKNLSGAKFKLEKCDTSASDTWTTVENFGEFEVKESGTAELTGLKAGRYRLTEVTAPTGYNILGDTIYFQVTGDGDLNLTNAEGSPVDSIQSMWTLTSDNSLVLTIKNTEIYSLPSAGGPGIYGFTISGVAFITAAILLFINNKRREGDIAE